MRKLLAVIGLTAFGLVSITSSQALDFAKIIKFGVEADKAKSISFAVAPRYAPDIVVDGEKQPWGLSVAAMYPVFALGADGVNYVETAAGLRGDWLANEFFTPSLDVTLQVPFLLFNTVQMTPFGTAGAIFPLGMGNDNGDAVGELYGGGVGAQVWSWQKGTTRGFVSVGGGAEKWGPYPGWVYGVGGAVTLKF